MVKHFTRKFLGVLWFGIISEHQHHRQFHHALELRVMMLICVAIILTFLAIYRLVDLTVVKHHRINILHQQGTPSQIARGDILDRNGVLLASDLKIAALSLEPSHIVDPVNDLRALKTVMPDLDMDKWQKRFASKKGFYWIKRKISPAMQQKINLLGIPGLKFHYGYHRVYPLKNLAAHILGYVNIDQKGISGIEKAYDTQLSMGSENITLTIDIAIQHILTNALQKAIDKHDAVGAAGVIMDVQNGHILALSSLPDFDPNHVKNTQAKKYFNRATKGVYELGSVFKIFNTAMLLEDGQHNISSIFDASKDIFLGRHRIADYRGKYKPLSVKEIFIYSSNIGSAKMALAVGRERQKEYLRAFGLLDGLNMALPEISTPQYPKKWRDVNVMTISFGHGIAVTPLHLTASAAAMVNGGFYHQPIMVNDFEYGQKKRVISKKTSDYVRKLMRLNVLKGSGRKAKVRGYFIGGKTGTAEKAGVKAYDRDSMISSFVGAFPMYDPRYVMFVMLDEPQPNVEKKLRPTGGQVAAPIIKEIVPQLAAHTNIMPVDPKQWDIINESLLLPEMSNGDDHHDEKQKLQKINYH